MNRKILATVLIIFVAAAFLCAQEHNAGGNGFAVQEDENSSGQSTGNTVFRSGEAPVGNSILFLGGSGFSMRNDRPDVYISFTFADFIRFGSVFLQPELRYKADLDVPNFDVNGYKEITLCGGYTISAEGFRYNFLLGAGVLGFRELYTAAGISIIADHFYGDLRFGIGTGVNKEGRHNFDAGFSAGYSLNLK